MYGNESGSKTASGQRFNENAMTCAHRSLPFGTKLRVTHGGRCVVVTVNDRGPFVRGRVLDLSTGAARALGLSGLGQVTARSSRKRFAPSLQTDLEGTASRKGAGNFAARQSSPPSQMTAGVLLIPSFVIPGCVRSTQARNPYSRWWLWIPGSPLRGAPE